MSASRLQPSMSTTPKRLQPSKSATRLQPGMLVYVKDNEEVWIEGEITSQTGQLFTVLAADKEFKCTEEAMLLRPVTALGEVDSLTSLPIINQASVLSCLHQRYSKGYYYTSAGSTIVAVNPFCNVPGLYSTHTALNYHCQKNTDPHIYRIGAEAYSCMVREQGKINQCIIVSGESGAGKTVSAKHLVRYMTLVSSPGLNEKGSSRGSVISQSIERRILDSNPILEAFGNAVTQRNDNSSRFGKFIQLQFSRCGQLEGATIQTYLLEKMRIVHQSPRECNFHIFYQIIKELRENGWMFGELHGEIGTTDFTLLPTGKELEVNRQLQTTLSAMTEIGLTEHCQRNIVMVLIAILYLGNIEFIPLEDEMSKLVADQVTQDALLKAANILGVTPSYLEQVFLYRNITSGHNNRQSVFVKPVPQPEAYSRRDCLATLLYSRVFDWLVSHINLQIQATDYDHTIGLLDIYGFEVFERNSLEQLCINYANEKLQQHYVKHFLKDLQREYESERISWQFLDYTDNQPCLDVIEGQPSVFGLLNEEVQLNRKSDTRSLCERILAVSTTTKHSCTHSKTNKTTYIKTPRLFHKTAGFTVSHYAGEVTYHGEELVMKNKDNIPAELLAILQGSSNQFVSGLFEDFQVEDTKGRKRKTVLSKFKASLDSLILALKSADVHYIRCIKPNTESKAGLFDRKYVMSQLVASGIIETVEVSQQGFPARMCYSSFLQRFGLIIRNVAPSTKSGTDSQNDDKLFDMVFKSQYDLVDSPRRTPTPKKRLRRREGLSSVDHTRSCCATVMRIMFGNSPTLIKQFGKTKLFLHQHQLEQLETTRLEVLSSKAGLIQRAWRCFHYRKTKHCRDQAAQKIQRAWRGFRDRRRRLQAVIAIQTCFRMMNARRQLIEMKQKAKEQQQRQEKQKSWRPIIDRKRKSSSQLRSSKHSKKRSSKLAENSLSSSRDSTLSSSRDSTLDAFLQDSREITLSPSSTPNTSTDSRQSGLSPCVSRLSVSGTDTEFQKDVVKIMQETETPSNTEEVQETAIRQPFSKLQETSSVPPIKKRRVEGGCKTTLEDLNVGDGILTRRRLPKVPIRFHTRPSVLKNAHIVHQRELMCGLQDCLPDDQSNDSTKSHGKENTFY